MEIVKGFQPLTIFGKKKEALNTNVGIDVGNSKWF